MPSCAHDAHTKTANDLSLSFCFRFRFFRWKRILESLIFSLKRTLIKMWPNCKRRKSQQVGKSELRWSFCISSLRLVTVRSLDKLRNKWQIWVSQTLRVFQLEIGQPYYGHLKSALECQAKWSLMAFLLELSLEAWKLQSERLWWDFAEIRTDLLCAWWVNTLTRSLCPSLWLIDET